MKKLQLLAAVACLATFGAFAQTTKTTTQTVTLTLTDVVDLTLTPQAGGNAFAFDALSKYESGLTNASATQLQVQSNKNWVIKVNTGSAFFTNSVSETTNMPSSVLGVSLAGANTFLTLSTAEQTLKSGNRGNTSASGNTFLVDYKATPAYNYDGGTYNIVVNYTVSQQ